jgi:hypothetical protein
MRASLGLLEILAGHFTLSSAGPPLLQRVFVKSVNRITICWPSGESAEPGAWGRGPGWRFARALRGDWQAEAPAPASVDCVGP